ncbi:unnamed protein product [Symbiodinium natans]|uniref:Uncharacterized protein n=1 Tax=Symbiodinium natans TaxID=878477 RepID=A0A812JGI0_9DINO|nr:unnamed protein product [Symbiodinium natans]
MGSYVRVSYREDGKGSQMQFEGVMADRRIGGTDRESYIELKNALGVGKENEIIAFEGIKRLYDAFIDDMDPAERRRFLCIHGCHVFVTVSWLAGTPVGNCAVVDRISLTAGLSKAARRDRCGPKPHQGILTCECVVVALAILY